MPEDYVLQDGEILRPSRIFLMDNQQQAVSRRFARDERRDLIDRKIAAHNACASHRRGYVLDSLYASGATVNAVNDDLLERRGVSLRDAMVERERALAETERRQQWRTKWKDQNGDDYFADPTHGTRGDYANPDSERSDSNALEAFRQRRNGPFRSTSVSRSHTPAWQTKQASAPYRTRFAKEDIELAGRLAPILGLAPPKVSAYSTERQSIAHTRRVQEGLNRYDRGRK